MVFSVYLLVAAVATSCRIWIDYVDTRNSVLQSLIVSQKAYERSVSRALWFLDSEYLETVIRGMMENPHVVGIRITGEQVLSFGKTFVEETLPGDAPETIGKRNGGIIAAGKTTPLEHGFSLVHRAEDGQAYVLGKALLYTSEGVILDKLRNKIILTMVNFTVLSITLGLIIYLIGRRILARPLGVLTHAIEAFDPDRPEQGFDLSGYGGRDELKVLARAFSQMQTRLTHTVASLRKSRSELINLNENLETMVDARTAELTEANKLLKEEIGERARAEEESSRLGAILENALNEIYIIDTGPPRFIYANRGAITNLGYSLEELKASAPVDIETEFSPEAFRELLTPLETGEKNVVVYHTVHRRKDGSRYNAEVHLQYMKFSRQSVFVAFVLDITEKLKMEEQLRQSHKMEAVGTLAGGIAHDFNNILGIIVGNTDLALEDLQDRPQAMEHLTEIRIAGIRARDLVRQLLSFSRKTEQRRKPLDPSGIIREAAGFMRSSLPAGIRIQTRIPENLGRIKADPTQLHQVLINLCTNAGHAMEEKGGLLALDLSKIVVGELPPPEYRGLNSGEYLQLTVADTGSGIEGRIREKIFDPYFTTKDVGKGTGMGLAVVHGIVKQHDGAVFLASKPGEGTRVRVLFPVTDEAAHEPARPSPEIPGGNEHLLLVDDEVSLLEMGRRILQRLSYRVTTCNDPLTALERFKAAPQSFDLLITDMTMPGMTGDQLARKILEIRPGFPIILCTGFSSRMDRKGAEEMGIRKFIDKPFNKETIGRAVREALS